MAMHSETTTIEMSEKDMKTLVRNALMVAGQEMGESGDHWPVIKNTITDIMSDWESLEAERAFQEEMKEHLYGQLQAMEEVLATCTKETQAEVAPRLQELREIYDAHFVKPDHELIDLTEADDAVKPLHIKRAEAILKTLEEDDE